MPCLKTLASEIPAATLPGQLRVPAASERRATVSTIRLGKPTARSIKANQGELNDIPRPRGALLCALTGLFFALLVLRFVVLWLNSFTGTSLPVPGSIGFTLLFTAFSLLHAASRLGWPRALVFLTVCAVVSWCFEAVGVETGLVYGAYHYSDRLGTKLGGVPIIIPLAWFMMVYASWVVSCVLLQGVGDPASGTRTAARIIVAAMAMTAWDTVMDPGMARAGIWTWEHGGAYFGVPIRNYAGWLATTVTVYAVTELIWRRLGKHPVAAVAGLYDGLPVFLYALIAIDSLLLTSFPELRIVAAFGMGFTSLLAVLRLPPAPTPVADQDWGSPTALRR